MISITISYRLNAEASDQKQINPASHTLRLESVHRT